MGAPSSKGCSFSLTGVMTHGPSLSHPSQPVVTSRDPYLRVYFAQISPFDFWAEMKAINGHERLSPKFRPKFREICLLAVRNFTKKFAY